MESLAELFAAQKEIVKRVKVSAPPPSQMRLAVASLTSAEVTIQNSEETPVLQERIAEAILSNNIHTLSNRDIRAICNVFLHSPKPPGRDVELGDAIIAEVQHRNCRQAPVLALFNAYLDGFRLGDSDIIRLAGHLNNLTERIANRNADNWASRARKLALFDPHEGPAQLADRLLASFDPPSTVLAEASLNTEIRVRGGLAEASFCMGCLAVERANATQRMSMQRRLIDWARSQDNKMLYPGAFTQFATALLEPWAAKDPEDTYRSELIQILESAGGGDPRTNPARWRELKQQSPQSFDTLIKWLTRASVLQFLEIVGRSISDPAGRLMWNYRRAFWTSYLSGDDGGPKITKAWIAFGSQAASLAKAAARESGDNSFTAFGRQYEKSTEHSALILEIGDLLIVDWSHNGKYNVWQHGDPGKPEFFKTSYHEGQLYSAPLKDSHSSPSTYTWQRKLASIIEGRHFYYGKPSWKPNNV